MLSHYNQADPLTMAKDIFNMPTRIMVVAANLFSMRYIIS